MQRPVVTRLSALCVAGAALTASANASATHYYAQHVAQVYGNADDGAFTSIWTNILHSTCNIFQHDFVTHEMWYGVVDTGAYWVEVGFFDGANGHGGCNTDLFFWADNTSGGGYNEHDTNWGATFGQWETLEVTTAGSCAWSVLLDGANQGTSTSNCPGSGRLLEAGIESTSQTTGLVKGWLGNWWEQNSGGGWLQRWDLDRLCQSTGNANNCTGGNPYIKWASGIGTEEVLNESF